ncbi:unnamed protein product [Amoebophrya sp. A25]|nr:unnamed protein product [Amoebophrya sp. A25]|eukprot:GSA25T00018899001.1
MKTAMILAVMVLLLAQPLHHLHPQAQAPAMVAQSQALALVLKSRTICIYGGQTLMIIMALLIMLRLGWWWLRRITFQTEEDAGAGFVTPTSRNSKRPGSGNGKNRQIMDVDGESPGQEKYEVHHINKRREKKQRHAIEDLCLEERQRQERSPSPQHLLGEDRRTSSKITNYHDHETEYHRQERCPSSQHDEQSHSQIGEPPVLQVPDAGFHRGQAETAPALEPAVRPRSNSARLEVPSLPEDADDPEEFPPPGLNESPSRLNGALNMDEVTLGAFYRTHKERLLEVSRAMTTLLQLGNVDGVGGRDQLHLYDHAISKNVGDFTQLFLGMCDVMETAAAFLERELRRPLEHRQHHSWPFFQGEKAPREAPRDASAVALREGPAEPCATLYDSVSPVLQANDRSRATSPSCQPGGHQSYAHISNSVEQANTEEEDTTIQRRSHRDTLRTPPQEQYLLLPERTYVC